MLFTSAVHWIGARKLTFCQTPLYLPDNAMMEVSMWRQTDDRKVWYEWVVEVYEQAPNGKRRKLGMSELHSSRRNGCLM